MKQKNIPIEQTMMGGLSPMTDRQVPIYRSGFFKTLIDIILVLVALYLISQVDYLFRPIWSALVYLLTPILLSLFLYYILRPLVRWLARKLKRRTPAILISFLLMAIIFTAIGIFAGSVIQAQVADLSQRFANYYDSVRNSISLLGRHQYLANIINDLEIEEKLGSLVDTIFPALQRNLFGLFSTVTNIGAILVLIPFILFYFLKDDRKFFHNALALLPATYSGKAEGVLREADTTLDRYIRGQLIVAVILGGMTFIGYLIIGLPNSFILALITTVTAFIPIFGAFLGAVPAALIGLAISPWLMVKVLIVLLIAQQLEGNLISPRLQGARMHIHPLMVLFVVIIAYLVFGVMGSLFAVPAYVVLRVVIKTFWWERIRKVETAQANQSE